MSRRNKIIILAISSVGVVAAGLLLYSWPISALSHWPQVPPPELFVTSQPKQEDVPGTYQLTRRRLPQMGWRSLKVASVIWICGLMGHSALRIIRDGRRTTIPPNLTWSRSSRRQATGVAIMPSISFTTADPVGALGFQIPELTRWHSGTKVHLTISC